MRNIKTWEEIHNENFRHLVNKIALDKFNRDIKNLCDKFLGSLTPDEIINNLHSIEEYYKSQRLN